MINAYAMFGHSLKTYELIVNWKTNKKISIDWRVNAWKSKYLGICQSLASLYHVYHLPVVSITLVKSLATTLIKHT